MYRICSVEIYLKKKLHAILINLLRDLTDMDNKMKRTTIFFTGTVEVLMWSMSSCCCSCFMHLI
jgi:hypothetical protein